MASSRESTATLSGEAPGMSNQGIAVGEIPDHLFDDDSVQYHSKKLIIAVDFGTTYSCVSYAALEDGETPQYLPLDRIESIQNYPNNWKSDPTDIMNKQVPTEIMYPTSRDFRDRDNVDDMESDEWGADALDEGDGSCPDQAIEIIDMPENDEDMSLDELMSGDSDTLRWGYGVHESRALPATYSNPNNKPLARFKLLLDESPMTHVIRNDLNSTLKSLQRKRIIQKPLQVIADFLTCLLRHTKSELIEKGYDDSWKVEMVLCVPAIWSQKACRDMQTAMAVAMEKARFEGVDLQNNSIENLFIVSEPEAAAAYVLANDPDIQPGDTFVLLDAGGGTVDTNTYTISRTTPLRLTREVVEPGGGLFGSSYLNEGFQKVLHGLLKDEGYLVNDVESIDGIIEKIMINEFEYSVKRHFDLYNAKVLKGVKSFPVSGLRDNPAKRFRQGCINVSMMTIRTIFLRLCEGIATIMEDQISKALQKGCRVEKVILQGGFAASKSLQKFIMERLEKLTRDDAYKIKLDVSKNTVTAVASGAVLRAFNKEQGPHRLARSSYGILRTEPFGDYEAHAGLKPSYDRHDGLPYIKKTVEWVLKRGAEVPPIWKCKPFLCYHTFDCWPVCPLVCKEELYVVDRAPESHYRLTHRMNEGAEKVGEIIVDFTSLREEGLIQPIEPTKNSSGRSIGVRHYRVNYIMVIRVVDRDLQCYAFYDGRIVKRCRINIASAFRPGVK